MIDNIRVCRVCLLSFIYWNHIFALYLMLENNFYALHLMLEKTFLYTYTREISSIPIIRVSIYESLTIAT